MKKTTLFQTLSTSLRPVLSATVLLISLAACSSLGLESDATYKDKNQEKLYKNGSLVRDEGGWSILGGDEKKDKDNGSMGVNAYLWRATLDTISFMPIASADPFGGVITTDWYSAPDAANERMKLNVLILDRDLRADGVRVSAFRQTRGVDSAWTDAPVSAGTTMQIEDSILTRARQMRLAKKEGL